MNESPQLSVILITPDSFDLLNTTLRHLRLQTIKDRIEVLFVSASSQQQEVDIVATSEFHSTRALQLTGISSSAQARAEAVKQATAPVVAFLEDHCFPEPDWAEKIVSAHSGPWAAVGPAICNANPGSAISWANLAIEYGPWMHPAKSGTRSHLPGHNGSYKRDVLLQYNDRLSEMMEAESVLHWDLRSRGEQLYLEAAARVNHLNFSTVSGCLSLRFQGGRNFAASRCARWGPGRRLFYAAASPLIPIVRAMRTVRYLKNALGIWRTLPMLPVLLAGLTFDAAGELFGYLRGAGGAAEKLYAMEFHREKYLSSEDRLLLSH